MASAKQSNVELMRDAYEAFNERNLEDVVKVFDEGVEWIEPEGWRYGGTYHGPEEVGSVFERAFGDIEDLELVTDRFIDAGATVVVVGSLHGTVAETGTSLNVPFAHVFDLEDGQVTRMQHYNDTALFQQALEA